MEGRDKARDEKFFNWEQFANSIMLRAFQFVWGKNLGTLQMITRVPHSNYEVFTDNCSY